MFRAERGFRSVSSTACERRDFYFLPGSIRSVTILFANFKKYLARRGAITCIFVGLSQMPLERATAKGSQAGPLKQGCNRIHLLIMIARKMALGCGKKTDFSGHWALRFYSFPCLKWKQEIWRLDSIAAITALMASLAPTPFRSICRSFEVALHLSKSRSAIHKHARRGARRGGRRTFSGAWPASGGAPWSNGGLAGEVPGFPRGNQRFQRPVRETIRKRMMINASARAPASRRTMGSSIRSLKERASTSMVS